MGSTSSPLSLPAGQQGMGTAKVCRPVSFLFPCFNRLNRLAISAGTVGDGGLYSKEKGRPIPWFVWHENEFG